MNAPTAYATFRPPRKGRGDIRLAFLGDLDRSRDLLRFRPEEVLDLRPIALCAGLIQSQLLLSRLRFLKLLDSLNESEYVYAGFEKKIGNFHLECLTLKSGNDLKRGCFNVFTRRWKIYRDKICLLYTLQ